LSALLSLNSFLIFFDKIFYEKISLFHGWLLVGCGVAFLLAGVHFFADIDQADLLGGGGELLG